MLCYVLFDKGIKVSNREVGKNRREEGQVLYSLQTSTKCFNTATHSFIHINSFKEMDKWVDVQAERGNDVVIMLVGNKIDLNKR